MREIKLGRPSVFEIADIKTITKRIHSQPQHSTNKTKPTLTFVISFDETPVGFVSSVSFQLEELSILFDQLVKLKETNFLPNHILDHNLKAIETIILSKGRVDNLILRPIQQTFCSIC